MIALSGPKRLIVRVAWLTLYAGGVAVYLAISLSGGHAAPQQELTTETIAAALKEYVLEHGPWKPGAVEVRVAGFKPVSLPEGPVKFRVLKPVKGITPGAHAFLLAVDVAGKEQSKMWVQAEVRVYAEVVVSSSPLAHHEMLTAGDVRVERRDVTSLSGRPFTQVSEVVGKQASRAIEVNEILTQSSLDLPKLIRRGAMVVLLYETGSLRVETPGVADEAGRMGDMIQVKNPTSGKVMRGLIVDGRTVKVN